ncbi:hypothetical protein GCM10027047_04610 [Rhodococcus aerolatus]
MSRHGTGARHAAVRPARRRARWVAGGVVVLALVVAARAGQQSPEITAAASTPVPTADGRADTTPAASPAIPAPAAQPVPQTVPGPPTTGSAPAPARSATGPGTPVRVGVASIGVDSALQPLGLQDDGTLEVPATGFPAGWYTGGPVPGAVGPAVLAGHVDWAGEPGVFSRLARTAVGDVVTVTDDAGRVSTFRVSSVGHYPKTAFPTAAVYGDVDHPALRLVTCGGDFDPRARSYVDDVVVFADEVATG